MTVDFSVNQNNIYMITPSIIDINVINIVKKDLELIILGIN